MMPAEDQRLFNRDRTNGSSSSGNSTGLRIVIECLPGRVSWYELAAT